MNIDPLIYVAAGLVAGLVLVAAFLGWAVSRLIDDAQDRGKARGSRGRR